MGEAEGALEGLGNPVFNVAGDDTRPLKRVRGGDPQALQREAGNCLYGDRKENAGRGR